MTMSVASTSDPTVPATSGLTGGIQSLDLSARAAAQFGAVGNKTPLMVLNEICQVAKLRVHEQLLSRDDVPAGRFGVRLTVVKLFPLNDTVATGTGAAPSKQEAKQHAAVAALQELQRLPGYSGLLQSNMRRSAAQYSGILPPSANPGFSSGVSARASTVSSMDTQGSTPQASLPPVPGQANEDYVDLGDTTWSEYPRCQQLIDRHRHQLRVSKTPKQLLHELGQGYGLDTRTEEVSLPSGIPSHPFSATVIMLDYSGAVVAKGRGSGTSKNIARQHAAAAAVELLLSLPEYHQLLAEPSVLSMAGVSAVNQLCLSQYPRCERRLELFRELGENKTPAMLLNEQCQRHGWTMDLRESAAQDPSSNCLQWACNITVLRPGAPPLEGFGTWNSKAAAKHFACAMLLERILEAEPSQQPLGQAQQPAPHGSETGEMSLKLLRDMPWLENAEAFPKTRKALSGRNSYKTPVALVNDVCTARAWRAEYNEFMTSAGGFGCNAVLQAVQSTILHTASTNDHAPGGVRSKMQAKHLAASLLLEALPTL